MKKFILILVVLMFVPAVLGISTDMKEVYAPSETMITEIRGNILGPIEKGDVEFLRGHVAVPLEYDVKKLGDKYYLWAIAPSNENNYTLKIKDIATTDSGKVVEIDYEQNFDVAGDIISYNIKPGFVLAREDFEIIVNLNEDLNRDISVSYAEKGGNVVLKPGENKLDFSVDDVEGTQLITIQIGDYGVPAYVFGTGKGERKIVLPPLRFRPRMIESVVLMKDVDYYPFQIVNYGSEGIEMEFEFDKDLFLIEPSLGGKFVVGSDEVLEFNLSLVKEIDSAINEIIYVKSGDWKIDFPINISLTENEAEVTTTYLEEGFTESSLYYCSELNGIQCNAGEICSGETSISLDGVCCVGSCRKESSGFEFSWVGYLIAGIVILIILIVWVRYKKTKVDKDKVMSKRISSAERNLP